MASVTGTLGGQPIVLDNAATEETLKKILAVLTAQNKALGAKTAGGGGAGAGAGAGGGGGVGGLGKEAGIAGKAMGLLGKAAGMTGAGVGLAFSVLGKVLGGIGGIMADLVGGAVKAAGALVGLAMKAFDGDVRMSDFFAAFKDLPFGIGLVAGLFEKLAKVQEEELDAFRRMTKTGIGFEGNLRDIRSAALDMGMSLEQFTATMSKNQEVFRGLGGDAESGAKAFVALNKTLRDSKAGAELRALGMSAEDSADAMANYIRANGSLTATQKQDYAGVAKSVAEYAKTTDYLAKLTGQSADELEKKMQKEADDAAWQATLLGMDEDQKNAANQALKVALATGGQGAVDALKAKIMGLPVMTEAGQKFVSMSANASKRLAEMEAVTKSNMTVEEKNAKLKELGALLELDRAKDAEHIGITALQAMSKSGDENAGQMLAASNKMKQAGITTEAQALENAKKAEAAQNKQMTSQAAAMAESEKNLKNLGQMVQNFISPIINVLAPLMSDIIKSFTEFVSGPNGKLAMAKFGTFIAGLIKEMMEYGKNLFTPEGRAKIINDVMTFFQGMWIDIKRAIAKMLPLGIGSLFYSEDDAKKDHEALEKRKEIEDERANLAKKMAAMEGDAQAAKLKLNADAMKAEQAKADKAKQDLAQAENDLKNKKDLSEVERAELENKRDIALKQKEASEDLIKRANAMETEKAKKINDDAVKIQAQINEKYKALGETVPKPQADQQETGRAGGSLNSTGSVLENFGSGKNMTLHGEEGVLTKEQLTNLAKGAKMSGASQGNSDHLLEQLNISSQQLVRATNEMVALQKKLNDKFTWTGNIFG